MKKIKISDVLNITKDILTKTCIYFSGIILLFNILGKFFGTTSFALNTLGVLHRYNAAAPSFVFMFLFVSFFAGAAAQVYKITKLPALSRHIAFFILLYIDFMLIVLLFSNYTPTHQNYTFLLSVTFIAIYLVIFGIVMGIKTIINYMKNKNLKYEKQFKNVK